MSEDIVLAVDLPTEQDMVRFWGLAKKGEWTWQVVTGTEGGTP